MSRRKHDDAHRPLQGRGARANRKAGRPANFGSAVLMEHRIAACSACSMTPCRCATIAKATGSAS